VGWAYLGGRARVVIALAIDRLRRQYGLTAHRLALHTIVVRVRRPKSLPRCSTAVNRRVLNPRHH